MGQGFASFLCQENPGQQPLSSLCRTTQDYLAVNQKSFLPWSSILATLLPGSSFAPTEVEEEETENRNSLKGLDLKEWVESHCQVLGGLLGRKLGRLHHPKLQTLIIDND